MSSLTDLLEHPDLPRVQAELRAALGTAITDQTAATARDVRASLGALPGVTVEELAQDGPQRRLPEQVRWLIDKFGDVIDSGKIAWCPHVAAAARSGTAIPVWWQAAQPGSCGCVPCAAPAAADDSTCDRCGAAGVTTFYPVMVPLGPVTLSADTCGACAAELRAEGGQP